jgi:protein-tyrosine phosphatase
MRSCAEARVFVHCKAGKSRSVMVILGYLIYSERLALQVVYEEVQRRREGIVPNLGFMLALIKFEKETLEK